MKSKFAIAIFVLAVIAAGIFLFLTEPKVLTASQMPDHKGDVQNGEMIFWAGGCASCHAAPGKAGEENPTVLAGGVELKTPFGTFVAPNLSPDPKAGIGGWSDLEFVNAMTKGVSPDGQHYYPAFPYVSYQRMTVEDVIDLKAYLDTLPVVGKKAAEHQLGFPFTVRRGLGLWKFLYLDGKPFTPDPTKDEVYNRGKYLVEGPSHCGECHTPRSPIGGLDRSRWLAGAMDAEGKGFVPNITPHENGLGGWSETDIAYALETGFTPEFDSFGGSMTDVQLNMARLPASDREAIARYLKGVPAIDTTKR